LPRGIEDVGGPEIGGAAIVAEARTGDLDDDRERRAVYLAALVARAGLAMAFALVAVGFGVAGWVPWRSVATVSGILILQTVANVVYWNLGKARSFPGADLAAYEVVDVVVVSCVIHFAGGIHLPYCAVAYLSLVLFAAVGESRAIAMRLAVLSILAMTTLVALEESGVVQSYAWIWGYRLPVASQVFALVVSGMFLVNMAWVGGSLSDKLKAANGSLREVRLRVEEQNRTLERKVAERTSELARATQEIEDLVHIVSHDLKNVAVAVTETARKLVARESPNLSDRGKAYADNVLEDGRTMSRMLEDLLLLFRHTEGAGARAEWVDVDAVVRQSLRQLQYQIEAKRIEVSVGPLPSVFADTQKMRHIFDNLLNNACKYVGDKKPARVDVGGEVNGATVKFFVRDNGVGMDERQQARMLQLYHRGSVQEVEGEVQDGHGVGLAIVKRIVERYGGEIVVTSAAREGTTFEVTLPRGDGTAA
jgi:signal transduction histidine kinase